MIEQGVYFSLGFLVAALLSLAVLPAFWRRAYRLTRREIEATLPLSPREIAAERDQLRAKSAVERVQLEQRVDAADADRQKAMALAGEKTIAIQKLDAELAARRDEIGELKRKVETLDTALGATRERLSGSEAALATMRGDLDQLRREHEALGLARSEVQDLADQRRVEIAAQKMSLEAQKARIEELDGALKAARGETRARMEELRESARALREKEKDLAVALSRLASAEEIAERRAQIIIERDAVVDQLRETSGGYARAAKQAEATAQQAVRRAEAAERLAAEREQAMGRIGDEGKATVADLSRSVDKLRGEKQKLQEWLAEARSKAAQLQRELAAIKRGAEGSVQDLRRKSVASD